MFSLTLVNNFKNMMGTDAYWYSHPENPYPFTPEQLKVVEAYAYDNLICLNSGLTSIATEWFNVPHPVKNPMIPCSRYPQIDFTAWKE